MCIRIENKAVSMVCVLSSNAFINDVECQFREIFLQFHPFRSVLQVSMFQMMPYQSGTCGLQLFGLENVGVFQTFKDILQCETENMVFVEIFLQILFNRAGLFRLNSYLEGGDVLSLYAIKDAYVYCLLITHTIMFSGQIKTPTIM
jgi:hypothetical protein